jgi:hypothetical protein
VFVFVFVGWGGKKGGGKSEGWSLNGLSSFSPNDIEGSSIPENLYGFSTSVRTAPEALHSLADV